MGVETVAVSQAPVVSGTSAAVAPPVTVGAAAAFPPVVQDLIRFFLSLTESSSQRAVAGGAPAVVSASRDEIQLCPSALGGEAAAPCAASTSPSLTARPPPGSASVPGSSGQLLREEVVSRSSKRRRRLSSGGTARASKRRPRDLSPSPVHSSRWREASYRSSSESSEEGRVESPPPTSGHSVPGGTPSIAQPASMGDRSPRPGPLGQRPRSSAAVDRSHVGFGGHLSPRPSGEADDDRFSNLNALDIDQDDSFRSVLALIRNFHGMEEPAGVPSARCKTSLASIYGLMSETSPAFHLPTSPLLRSLLDDTNLALSKFLEDQTVHGFLPVPSRRHRRYYRTSSSSFPGPYSVPPGMTSITLEKASEVKKPSVSLSASQVSSMETMLSGVCEVTSWLDWWLSTCGGFREHLPVEVRADFERLIISGSRALEFLASQGITALANLVLARRDSLLADACSTVPVEEVARLRYSALPETVSIFPSHLLDSALSKMCAAANNALVQRTHHPPRIPWKTSAGGVGRSPPRSTHVRCVVGPGKVAAHQSSRDEGSVLGAAVISRRRHRPSRDGDVRQLDGHGVRQQARGHGFPCPMLVGQPPSEMDRESRHPSRCEVSSRAVQCPGRSPQPSRASCRDRVVSLPSGGEVTALRLGRSVDRPLCDEPQCETAPLLLPSSRSTGRLRGRVSSSLGRSGCVHVPSFSSGEWGSRLRSRVVASRDDSGRTPLAREGVVRRPSASTDPDPTTSRPPLVGQSALAASQQPLPPRRPRAEPSHVETLKQHFQKSGFSRRAAGMLSGCLRASTSRLYQSRWRIFCGWCRGRGIDPVNATVPLVVDFLIHLRQDKGLSVSAVKGYNCALTSVLALKGRDLASSREITMLFRSFSRSVDPVELRPPA